MGSSLSGVTILLLGLMVTQVSFIPGIILYVEGSVDVVFSQKEFKKIEKIKHFQKMSALNIDCGLNKFKILVHPSLVLMLLL